MRQPINKQRLTNLLKGIQKSIDLFPSQGYQDVYFTAHFTRDGKKQNGIERGDIDSFAHQIRTYVESEEADNARVDFYSESSGKCIYSKALSDLRLASNKADRMQAEAKSAGLSGFMGLGEAQVSALVDRKVTEARTHDELARLNREMDELRGRNGSLQSKIEELEIQRTELETNLKAKKDVEYYMGIIGAAFPGLANLLTGTPLAQAANFLAGTTDINGNALESGEEEQPTEIESIAIMISDFCCRLDVQQANALYLIVAALERDRAQIQKTLHFITTQTPTAQ